MSATSEPEVTGIVAVLGHPEEVRIGFPWSVALARQARVPLTLLHVIDPVATTELAVNARAMAEDMLSLLAASESLSDLDVRTRVETGMPETIVPGVRGRVPRYRTGACGRRARCVCSFPAPPRPGKRHPPTEVALRPVAAPRWSAGPR